MKIKNFIGASSAILVAWIGATYLHEVPSEPYRQKGLVAPSIPANAVTADAEMVAGNR